jgi:hypothetical protein
MRYVVTCFSQTGNTRKVAEAIAAALPEDVAVCDLAEAPLDGADLVFVGMPVVRFGAPDEARTFLQKRCRGRRVALFVTHAAGEDMPELQPWLQTCRDAAEGCEIVDFFHCQGQLAEPVRQWMAGCGMPDLVGFAEMAGAAAGQPDETRLRAAADFAARVTGEPMPVSVAASADATD